MRVTPAGYAHLVSSLSALCGGRLVVMLEGGYCLDSLSEAAALTLRTLLGDAAPSLPPTGQIDPSVLKSILGTTAYLSPYWKCMRIRETVSEIEKPILQVHYPVLEFRPPPDFPPAKFPTRDYYLVFSEAVQEKWKLEIAHINLATRLRQTQYKVGAVYYIICSVGVRDIHMTNRSKHWRFCLFLLRNTVMFILSYNLYDTHILFYPLLLQVHCTILITY